MILIPRWASRLVPHHIKAFQSCCWGCPWQQVRSDVCVLPRWGVIRHSPTLGRHLGFPVTLLVCLFTQAQSGHSGIAWYAWGSRLYLPRPRVRWLRANTWYLSKAVKAPLSSLPRMASRQTPTELFTCQFWKVSTKISSDRCKWMGAFLAFLCGNGSCHLDHLVCPPSSLCHGPCLAPLLPFQSASVYNGRYYQPCGAL